MPDSAGYSHPSLVKKLGIKEGHRLATIAAPPGFDVTLGQLPERVLRARSTSGDIDVVILFAREVAGLSRSISSAKRSLAVSGMLWVCWPKKASAIDSDLDDNVVRGVGLGAGLVDVKVCAIDATWSGLKFVYRLTDRAKAATLRRERQRS